jgi:hypothetical protein
VKSINFTEISSKYSSSSALFVFHSAEFQTVTLENCIIQLEQNILFTQEGGNFNIVNSFIEVSRLVRLMVIHASLQQCPLYEKEGSINNVKFENCTFRGHNNNLGELLLI